MGRGGAGRGGRVQAGGGFFNVRGGGSAVVISKVAHT